MRGERIRVTVGLLVIAALSCAASAQGQDLQRASRREPSPWPSQPSLAQPGEDPPEIGAFRTSYDRPGDVSNPFGDYGEHSSPSATNESRGWDMLGLYGSNDAYRGRGERLADLAPICDDCPTWGTSIFVGYDSFRGVADGGWGNNGIHTGADLGTRLGKFSEWTGIGAQVGGSVGVYNWSGNDYHFQHQSAGTTQGFFTYGFFRKATEGCPWSASIVQDWMWTSNYGVFGQDPTMSQFRGQAGYALSSADELGVWGAWRGWGETESVSIFGPVTYRPINQVSAYWHHKWGVGDPDTWLWVGVPERHRLEGNGSLGDYYVGVLANAPLNDSVALYAQVTYMHPSASPGPGAAKEDQWNFFIGLQLFPARNARSRTVAGQCWMPQLPVANNGTFLVDASQNY